MEIDPIVDAAALDKSVRKSIVDQGLHKIKSQGEELWKWRVICGIYTLLFEHYDRLIDANIRSFPQHTIAYHTRCLLELMVWTEFAIQSDDNIKSIHADSLNDSMNLLIKLKQFSENPITPFTIDFKTSEDHLKELATKEGLENPTKKFLDIKEFCSNKGLLEFYLTNNKILSKVVHPTGFSIVGMTNTTNEAAITQAIVREGCRWYAASVRVLSIMFDLEITLQSDSTI